MTAEGLDFSSKKRNLSFPLESISIISFGLLGRDVDTDWVILSLDHPGLPPLIAFRDGRRLGYGQRTEEIFQQLRRALRQLSAAQYGAPAGLEVYDRMDSRFTFAIPEGWNHFLYSSVYTDQRLRAGLLIFSPIRLSVGKKPDGDGPTVVEVRNGRAQAFSLQLSAALRGMACEGFAAAAQDRLRHELQRAVSLGAEAEPDLPQSLAPFSFGGCQGIRAEGRHPTPGGGELLWDLRAVSDGETLFVFTLRSDEGHYDDHRQVFGQVLETFRLVLAR